MRSLFLAAALAALAPAAHSAGQPFLVMEDDLNGSLLNFFFGGLPSDIYELNVSGTVTNAIGAPSLDGAAFAFETSVGPGDLTATMILGSDSLGPSDIFASTSTVYSFNPFSAAFTPGNIEIPFFVIPPDTTGTPNAADPSLFDFSYGGAFSEYPNRTGEFPEFELVMNIFYDGDLPTKVFDDPVLGPFDYIEGNLNVTRITLGTVGGDPLPPTTVVPVPATLPLALGALGLLAAIRRRDR
ncbi:MAG: hypothetical protein AAGA87_17515 [Pseudomonadota bacterium]